MNGAASTVDPVLPRPLTDRKVSFETGKGADRFRCNVINVKGPDAPTKGPVLLIHGGGVSSDVFRAPVKTSLVDYLVDSGYDVWLENWRASIHLNKNPWTLDKAAAYDHPRAVETVLAETGKSELKVVAHCQGSTSFMMSAIAGLVPQVTTVVCNAVSLHPIVPPVSRVKINLLTPIVSKLMKEVNPHSGIDTWNPIEKAMVAFVRATHRECDNTVCRMVSFYYGAGRPALWRHDNLNPQTHYWIRGQFAWAPMTFFLQMRRCVAAGHLVAVDGLAELPQDFVAKPPGKTPRFAFFTGRHNRCFVPESQQTSFEYFDRLEPGRHSFVPLDDYAHLDVFMGKNAARDVFPAIVRQLEA